VDSATGSISAAGRALNFAAILDQGADHAPLALVVIDRHAHRPDPDGLAGFGGGDRRGDGGTGRRGGLDTHRLDTDGLVIDRGGLDWRRIGMFDRLGLGGDR
jgi:hypothetical protein